MDMPRPATAPLPQRPRLHQSSEGASQLPLSPQTRRDSQFPLLPGLLLGLGAGGLFDGILLHQLLQWHHMLSSWYPPTSLENLRINTVADGLFHAVTWVLIVTGVFTLWRAAQHVAPPSWRWLAGSLLAGWGMFNLVEGVIDHLLLGVHHVNETASRDAWLWWDLGFLVWGAAMLAIGWKLCRRPGM